MHWPPFLAKPVTGTCLLRVSSWLPLKESVCLCIGRRRSHLLLLLGRSCSLLLSL
uniref:Uncharacterized protein n=1 Tax=Brassica oleracea TaxID=3712 RepID=A0A3P6DF88_BRAOL|nr:unnamed protein product [Brassica oleracea]